MGDPAPRSPEPDPEPEAADAAWLVDPDQPPAGAGQQQQPIADEVGSYELIDAGPPEPPASPSLDASPHPARPAVPTREKPHVSTDAPADRVEQVWSRGAEWWPTLLALAGVVLATVGLAYVTFDVGNLAPTLLILFVGGLIGLIVSYPIVITLERPVRVTPEQAVKDYFGALSHHRPHYRRMWLLLSALGRVSGEFGSLDGFQAYWRRRLAELRGGRISDWTPLVFLIDDFTSDRSAGRSEVEARYTVRVYARGRRDEGPLASIACRTSLVRGPDRMWYLSRGTLPRGEA